MVAPLPNAGPLIGHWYKRDAQTRARRRGLPDDDHLFAVPYAVTLTKIPCWDALTDDEYTARVAALVRDIERDAAAERARTGAPVLGMDAVLAQSPEYRPRSIARSPAPLCHAATRAAYHTFRAAYRVFVDAYRRAAHALACALAAPHHRAA